MTAMILVILALLCPPTDLPCAEVDRYDPDSHAELHVELGERGEGNASAGLGALGVRIAHTCAPLVGPA